MRITPVVLPLFYSISVFAMAPATGVLMTQTLSGSAVGATSGGRLIYTYTDLRSGTLVSRYKRFLADVDFETAPSSAASTILVANTVDLDTLCEVKADMTVVRDVTVVHCPNTGSMYKLVPPHNMYPECACSTALEGTKRKYPNTLEMIKENSAWVGVHSALANRMVENALNANLIEGCMNFTTLQREVKVHLPSGEKSKGGKGSKAKAGKETEESRIDFKLSWDIDPFGDKTKTERKVGKKSKTVDEREGVIYSAEDGRSDREPGEDAAPNGAIKGEDVGCFMLLEVKSVTLAMQGAADGEMSAQFPDSVSERGQKHLRCLMEHVKRGGRAGILFLIQRDDCCSFSACHLDPAYGPLLHDAYTAGVLILPYHCRLDPSSSSVTLLGRLPFVDTYAKSNIMDRKMDSSRDDTTSSAVKNKSKKTKIKFESVVSTIMDMTTDVESNALCEGRDSMAISALDSDKVAASEIVSVKRVRSKRIT